MLYYKRPGVGYRNDSSLVHIDGPQLSCQAGLHGDSIFTILLLQLAPNTLQQILELNLVLETVLQKKKNEVRLECWNCSHAEKEGFLTIMASPQPMRYASRITASLGVL